jgi:hypothetical protein
VHAIPVTNRGTITLTLINGNIYAVADFADDSLVYVRSGDLSKDSEWAPVKTTLTRNYAYDLFRSAGVVSA